MAQVGTQTKQFVTMRIDGQLFGVAVTIVEDVLRPQRMTKAPLSPNIVVGSINLRGCIVTVVSVRTCLGLPSSGSDDYMLVVVQHEGVSYSLKVDAIGDVLTLPIDDFEKNPSNLSEAWRNVSMGVYRLDGELLVVLDIEKLLDIKKKG